MTTLRLNSPHDLFVIEDALSVLADTHPARADEVRDLAVRLGLSLQPSTRTEVRS